MFRVKIDKDLCIGCGNCIVACPNSASLSAKAGHGVGDSENKVRVVGAIAEFDVPCSGCGICLEVCPLGAVEILAEGELVPEEEKPKRKEEKE